MEFTFFNPKKKIKNLKRLQLVAKETSLFKYRQEFGFVLNQKKLSVVANLLNKIHNKKETDKVAIINGKRIK